MLWAAPVDGPMDAFLGKCVNPLSQILNISILLFSRIIFKMLRNICSETRDDHPLPQTFLRSQPSGCQLLQPLEREQRNQSKGHTVNSLMSKGQATPPAGPHLRVKVQPRPASFPALRPRSGPNSPSFHTAMLVSQSEPGTLPGCSLCLPHASLCPAWLPHLL